jgi:hypothetical protein
MHTKKFKKFMQSFVAMPMLVVITPFSGFNALQSQIVTLSQNSVIQSSVITTQEEKIREERAEKIDAYFKEKGAPLAGFGETFVEEAEKNGLDWRLLPAIAMRESTGGKQACKKAANSVFGYGSCKMSFKSIDDSIRIVAESLGGNNPNTARYYEGKTTEQILRKYNSVIPKYPQEVLKIMESIGEDPTDLVA